LQTRTVAILDRHGLEYDLDWQLSGEPFLTPTGDLVNAVVSAVHDRTGTRAELSTGGGTSDGRFIASLGTQVVELGLLNASIHKIDEQVAVADLELLSGIYRGLLERLLLLPR
jgi:succinyl-diaminopimelate desuccinylase